MGWLVALIAVGFFIWLLIKYPGFRFAIIVVLGILVVGIMYLMHSENAREARSHSLIAPSQLVFSDVRIRNLFGWQITGTIKNNSQHTLTGLTLKVTVRDCPSGSPCVVIGEDKPYIFVTMPPSQLRKFEDELFFSGMPKPTKPEWSYQIVQTDAD